MTAQQWVDEAIAAGAEPTLIRERGAWFIATRVCGATPPALPEEAMGEVFQILTALGRWRD